MTRCLSLISTSNSLSLSRNLITLFPSSYFTKKWNINRAVVTHSKLQQQKTTFLSFSCNNETKNLNGSELAVAAPTEMCAMRYDSETLENSRLNSSTRHERMTLFSSRSDSLLCGSTVHFGSVRLWLFGERSRARTKKKEKRKSVPHSKKKISKLWTYKIYRKKTSLKRNCMKIPPEEEEEVKERKKKNRGQWMWLYVHIAAAERLSIESRELSEKSHQAWAWAFLAQPLLLLPFPKKYTSSSLSLCMHCLTEIPLRAPAQASDGWEILILTISMLYDWGSVINERMAHSCAEWKLSSPLQTFPVSFQSSKLAAAFKWFPSSVNQA